MALHQLQPDLILLMTAADCMLRCKVSSAQGQLYICLLLVHFTNLTQDLTRLLMSYRLREYLKYVGYRNVLLDTFIDIPLQIRFSCRRDLLYRPWGGYDLS